MRKKCEENRLDSFCKKSGLEHLLNEWDHQKNAPLSPADFSKGSNRRVWWKCKYGHEWEAQINKRTQGKGCPYCAGRKVIPGFNDLKTLVPKLESEWDYDKNYPLTPSEVTIKSSKKVWWKCEKGHEWYAAIYHRSNGRGCPECAKTLIGEKSRKPHKQFEEELRSLNPQVKLVGKYNGSHSKITTQCLLCNEKWDAWPSDLMKGIVCPNCSQKARAKKRQKTILELSGSLEKTMPELVKEWHPTKNEGLSPSQVTKGSTKKAWWKCEKGHEWEASIASRARGLGCPFCSNKKVLSGFNDLATSNPKLAEEWHPTKNGEVLPSDVTAGSGKSVWWRCDNGHEWQSTIVSRVRGNGCPYCSRRTVVRGVNDLLTVNPELAAQWHPTLNGTLTPQDVMAGSEKKVWWICDKGHAWKTMVYSRLKGNGCPVCSNQMVLKGYNDLVTLVPRLVEEWHPTKNGNLKPEMFTPGSGKMIWWLCRKGHEWKTTIKDRAKSNGTGCPQCQSERQTSFPEQTVFFYLSQKYAAVNRYKEDGVEVDVYLPSLRIGIEYDGAFYHNSEKSIQREHRKEKKLKEKGIRIIRIKESDKNMVDGDVVMYKYNYSYDCLPWAIKETYSLLNENTEPPDINISRDRDAILSMYIENEKENSLAIKLPHLLDEWDYDKNSILPTMVSFSSMMVVNWKCKEGHEWSAVINSRASGSGCPVCGQLKRAENGYRTKLLKNGTLKEKCPDLAKEWHPTKNGALTPDDVTGSSGRKVWWICDKGHEYTCTVSNRRCGNGCPICGKKRMADKQRKTHEVFAMELMAVNPNVELIDTYKGNKTKLLCRCKKCSHEWFVIPSNLLKGRGCPRCAKNATKRILCVETGKVYNSISEAREATHCSGINNCVNGKSKTSGGYHWRLID